MRVGSHVIPKPDLVVPANIELACAIELDEASLHLNAALEHMERLGKAEGAQRIRMSRAALGDAIDELHADDPEVDDDE